MQNQYPVFEAEVWANFASSLSHGTACKGAVCTECTMYPYPEIFVIYGHAIIMTGFLQLRNIAGLELNNVFEPM